MGIQGVYHHARQISTLTVQNAFYFSTETLNPFCVMCQDSNIVLVQCFVLRESVLEEFILIHFFEPILHGGMWFIRGWDWTPGCSLGSCALSFKSHLLSNNRAQKTKQNKQTIKKQTPLYLYWVFSLTAVMPKILLIFTSNSGLLIRMQYWLLPESLTQPAPFRQLSGLKSPLLYPSACLSRESLQVQSVTPMQDY